MLEEAAFIQYIRLVSFWKKMGASASGCVQNTSAGDVLWYPPDSPDSQCIQNMDTGFGIGRNKSYMAGLKRDKFLNRSGNLEGELEGKIIFYNNVRKYEDYSAFSQDISVHYKNDMKIYAKAFMRVPLGRLPLGENNLIDKKLAKKLPAHIRVKAEGHVLLTMAPRAVALFVTVDDHPYSPEYLCIDSVLEMEKHYRTFEPRPNTFRNAIPGSFLTFVPHRKQDEFFFIHLPLVADHQDTITDAGTYGTILVSAFCRMLAALTPGKHSICLQLKCYYDHCDYNCFMLNKNMNALAKWHSGLSNLQLTDSHPYPTELMGLSQPLAEGTLDIVIPQGFWSMVEVFLDRKPPREIYIQQDKEAVRREARVVAAGRFCDSFGLDGLPDLLVLMTPKREQNAKDEDTGYRYKYEYVEFAALWINHEGSSPNSEGTMLEGCMSRGEVNPKQHTRSWIWSPLIRAGKITEPLPLPVMNKYIKQRMQNQT